MSESAITTSCVASHSFKSVEYNCPAVQLGFCHFVSLHSSVVRFAEPDAVKEYLFVFLCQSFYFGCCLLPDRVMGVFFLLL